MKSKSKKKINGKLVKYGFDPSKIEVKPEDWHLGAIVSAVLKEDGDWSKHLPIYEAQSNANFDSYGCTCFGSLNQIEILLNFLEGKEYNFAERYPYNIVEIEPPGANPNDVYQAIRHNGLLVQEELPWALTDSEFKSPRPMTEELKIKGRKWLENYTLEHEWIVSPTHEDIASALKFSPIGLSVTAWFEENGLYIDNGQANTHWCVCFRADKTPKGYVLHIFDSYDHSIKLLHPSHKISFAKSISIKKKDPVEIIYKENNWFSGFLKVIWSFIKWW